MIEVNNQVKARISLQFIKGVLNKTLKKLKKKVNLSVALVDNKTIRRLNKKYRRIDKVTDVLSFDYGEIIICYPRAKKQAQKLKHSISQELKILLIHSLLHLLGYEHKTKQQRIKMKKLEDKLCLLI
jgi:probable rRNA maturation factor